ELWGEGFRWFDLKRLNLPLYRTGSNFKESFCGFLEKQPTDNGWYYEIPKAETDYNTLMEKNY
ncbi:MAG: RagB/SusD family nutrient uptake outer membrane protein, partial [Prevotella sp.]|nr:RagB/SusD family nutrient uptake outer membrane protein [Prevotella sp.]